MAPEGGSLEDQFPLSGAILVGERLLVLANPRAGFEGLKFFGVTWTHEL